MRIIESKKNNGYHVYIGGSPDAGEIIRLNTSARKVAVIADESVAGRFAGELCESLQKAGIRSYLYLLDGGENAKSIDNYVKILTFLAENGFTKSDAVAALGGGTLGDTAGFCAATYMRGIKLVMLPTSLLSMVDSAIGGKNALNMPQGKNLIGTVYMPNAVIMNTDYLQSLPMDIYNDAFSEIIKYGVIADRSFFDSCNELTTEEMIARCVEIKLSYVEKDEFDSGIRHCLNFGHTVAHAVEKCSGNAVSHGKAVAVGMAVTAAACERNGICPHGCADAVISKLKNIGLPVKCDFTGAEMMKYIAADKKIEGSSIHLAVITDIGKSKVISVALDELEGWLFG